MTSSTEPTAALRFASYARTSTETQQELSIDGQFKANREEIARRGGVLVAEFVDDAKSGWSLDRAGLNELRAFVAAGNADAIMFWKFDRLMRDHIQTTALKLLFRHEYGVKLFCVEGYSEDDDASLHTAMMEQMLSVFAAFYSKNLSIDTKRAKRTKAEQGEFNGSQAPIGYILVTKDKGTKDRPKGLYPHPTLAPIVQEAFRRYAGGGYSYHTLALWMMSQVEVQIYRAGQKPMDKEGVRHMLQNRVYAGRVSHSETVYNGELGQRRKGYRDRREWFEGKHQALISDALFAQCDAVRDSLASIRPLDQKTHSYLLNNKVFCAYCLEHKPVEIVDDNCGRVRPYWSNKDGKGYYRCTSTLRGYAPCEQSRLEATKLHSQLLEILTRLQLPRFFRDKVIKAVAQSIQHEAESERMAEIRRIAEQVDFSWEDKFIDKQDYLLKRQAISGELAALPPVNTDSVQAANNILSNFREHWELCAVYPNPVEDRKRLVAKLVDRVFILDKRIVALTLNGGLALIIAENERASAKTANALREVMGGRDLITLLPNHFRS